MEEEKEKKVYDSRNNLICSVMDFCAMLSQTLSGKGGGKGRADQDLEQSPMQKKQESPNRRRIRNHNLIRFPAHARQKAPPPRSTSALFKHSIHTIGPAEGCRCQGQEGGICVLSTLHAEQTC